MLRTMVPFRTRIPTFAKFGNEMEDLMEHFFNERGDDWRMGNFTPHINLVEMDEGYEVTVELPGLKPEEVNVEIRDGCLWVFGEKKEELEETGKTFHKIERRTGEFRRVIPFTVPVDEGKIEAAFEHGILKVRIPKTEEIKPKKIKVEVK